MHPNKKRHLSILEITAFALLAAGSIAVWVSKGRAHHYPDAPQGKLACISYTPRSDSTTSTEASVHAQIETDLKQLASRTRCVRTYSVMNGLDHVPAAARKQGLRVLLGVWISSNDKANEQELTHAIDVAQANKDVIDAIIVGNEVLLRREQKADALGAMLRRVHAATGMPVTYADVWDFWVKNPQLAAEATFITIHILPYWEDQPVSIGQSLSHIENIYNKVQRAFPGRRIFLGETGWPSAGRQREAALPSRINQARFFREFVAYADTHALPYNFIEAYDQPWKRRLEGTVGGYWGIYDAQGKEKFSLIGPVVEDNTWWRGLLAAGSAGVLWLLVAWVFRWAPSWPGKILWFAAGLGTGAIALLQWDYLWQANRTSSEWWAMAAWSIAGYAVLLLNLKRLTNDAPPDTGQFARYALLALLIGVAYIDVGLCFDARYRGFPTIFIVLPTVALALRAWRDFSHRVPGRLGVEELLLAWCLLVSVPWIVWNERLSNLSALHWCVWSALLAIPILANFHVQAREQQRAGQQA